MLLLITKYNLSPKWVHLFLFFIVYIILIKLHYIHFNDSFAECMQRSNSFEKEKEILQIASQLRQKSTMNSTWNGVREYWGYDRIDTATIDNPLKKAEFLERYAEFVKNIRKNQVEMQKDYQTLSEKHEEKIQSLLNLEKNFEDQKIQLQELRRANEQQTNNLRIICQTIPEQLSKIETLIDQKSTDILHRTNTSTAFSKRQLNYMRKSLAEIAISVGVTETTCEELNSKQSGFFDNFEQEFTRNENLVDHIKNTEVESNNIQRSLEEKNRAVYHSALDTFSILHNVYIPAVSNALRYASPIVEGAAAVAEYFTKK